MIFIHCTFYVILYSDLMSDYPPVVISYNVGYLFTTDSQSTCLKRFVETVSSLVLCYSAASVITKSQMMDSMHCLKL